MPPQLSDSKLEKLETAFRLEDGLAEEAREKKTINFYEL